jgi:hypothetical protein
VSDHIQHAIEALEQEIEALDQRRGELVRAVDAMRPLAGNGTERQHAGKRKTKIPRKTKRALKRNERTNEQKPGRRGASLARRSLPKKTGIHHQAILDILRVKGPQSPGELMKRAGFENLAALRYNLKPLLKSGAVVATGKTTARQISLAGSRPKEGL